ncbi:MAG: hypothetical protein GX887_02495 [Firmicutes bacterium]|nr:hypothetical protein [Bacillota bacterium]
MMKNGNSRGERIAPRGILSEANSAMEYSVSAYGDADVATLCSNRQGFYVVMLSLATGHSWAIAKRNGSEGGVN